MSPILHRAHYFNPIPTLQLYFNGKCASIAAITIGTNAALMKVYNLFCDVQP